MAEHEKELHFTVVYRGTRLQLKALAGSTLGDLGKEIVDLTGVAPHTLRLILPKRPPLQPMSEQHSTKLLYQSGITEGLRMTMMGSSIAEVAAVSLPVKSDRIIGFAEEDQRARQRSVYAAGADTLPKGNYIFCEFQTLALPGVVLNPPPAVALRIMHKLASDRGITAIMNKYRWRVGIMTEMAPIGYVGVSPKCILGFNKNRGQEISLRLRTDDLKGFRKYESIKKTLLHELAHMVHDEHDEKFHALDKKLNEEAIALDWTKSHGHTLSGVKFENEEDDLTASSSLSSRGYKLGGSSTDHFVDARTAAAAAALRRLGEAARVAPRGETSLGTLSTPSEPGVRAEPDPDAQDSQSPVVVASGMAAKDGAFADEVTVCIPVRNAEPDPDEAFSKNEPDPDEAIDIVTEVSVRSQEPDPDEAIDTAVRSQEPDPDEGIDTDVRSQEPDPDAGPDEASGRHSSRNEPDPDEAVDMVLDASVRKREPDPDEALGRSSRSEPDADEAVDMVLDASVGKQEPDPDEALGSRSSRSEPDPDEALGGRSSRNEPDPDEAVDRVCDALVRKHEPDPDEASGGHFSRHEPDPDEAVGVVLDAPVRMQEPDPDEVMEADRDLEACVGCSRMAGNRMKSFPGSGFTNPGKPQT